MTDDVGTRITNDARKLSIAEAAIYLGMEEWRAKEFLRQCAVLFYKLTPRELDQLMGWHQPSPALDRERHLRATFPHAQPFGTSSGSARSTTEYRGPPGSHRRADDKAQSKPSTTRRPQPKRSAKRVA